MPPNEKSQSLKPTHKQNQYLTQRPLVFWAEKKIDIFIPIYLAPPRKPGDTFFITELFYLKNAQSSPFDFQALAEHLNAKSKNSFLQIASSDKVALSLINKHRHHYISMIVKVTVCEKRLSKDEVSGKEGIFLLAQNQKFKAQDIGYARSLKHDDLESEYKNTICFAKFLPTYGPIGSGLRYDNPHCDTIKNLDCPYSLSNETETRTLS